MREDSGLSCVFSSIIVLCANMNKLFLYIVSIFYPDGGGVKDRFSQAGLPDRLDDCHNI